MNNSSILPLTKLQIFNWAEDIEKTISRENCTNRIVANEPAVNVDNVPADPPYTIYISNLPYDTKDEEVADLFPSLKIISLRIPQDNRFQKSKIKGFGYVEFEKREDLIKALSYQSKQIRNRLIKVELANDVKNRNFAKNSNKCSRSKSTWRNDAKPIVEHRRYSSCVRVENNNMPTLVNNKLVNMGHMDCYGRTKLHLKPRTIPFKTDHMEGKLMSPSFLSAGSIFGNATPVDTRAKEKMIEERLAKEKDLLNIESYGHNKTKRHHSKTYTSKTRT